MLDYKCYNLESETKGNIDGTYYSFASESEYEEMYEEYKEETE